MLGCLEDSQQEGSIIDTGRSVRSIQLVEKLGGGGMGEVWLGRDEVLGRSVAVKAVREERRLSEKARSRFLREARVLSRLEHPNICRLYDYVEDHGEQFIVLEYVEGENLTRSIERGMSDEQRIQVAIQITSALAAAHSMSVIHRDLKPANVMLTADGVVKVLDFGLARPARAPLLTAALEAEPESLDVEDSDTLDQSEGAVTRFGDLVGTLRYMSPEQARGERVTAASDVYSLGLLLQELFTGETAYSADLAPLELLNKAKWGDRRAIRGGRPEITALIDRLTTLEAGPRPSAPAIEEELRQLSEAPRLRRRRRLRVAAVLVLAALTVALALLAVGFRREADRANREARAAEATSAFLVDLFRVSDPYRSEQTDVTARELLERGVQQIRHSLDAHPGTQMRLLTTLGEIYGNLGESASAVELLEEALKLVDEQAHPDSHHLVQLLADLADAHMKEGDIEMAEQILDRAQVLAEPLPDGERRFSLVLHNRLILLMRQGRFEEAQQVGRKCLEIRQRELGPEHVDTAISMGMLGLAILDFGDYEEAEALLARTLEIVEKHFPAEHPTVVQGMINLATARKDLGRLDEAEAMYRQVLPRMVKRLGPDHPAVATAYNDLGVVLVLQQSYLAAEEAYRHALEIAERSFGSQHALVGVFLGNSAEVVALDGRADEARDLYRRSLEVLRATLGNRHPVLADPLRGLALVEAELDRPERAEALFLEAISIREETQGAEHPELGRTWSQLGEFYLGEGRNEDAIPALLRALAILESALGADDETVENLAERLVALGISSKARTGQSK